MEKGKISYTQNTLNPCWLFYPLADDLESKFSLSKKMKQHISDSRLFYNPDYRLFYISGYKTFYSSDCRLLHNLEYRLLHSPNYRLICNTN